MSPRPLVVWITTAVVAIYTIVVLVLLGMRCLSYWEYVVRDPSGMVIVPLLKLSVLALVGVGLFQRWQWARWVAVVVIVAWAAYGYYDAFAPAKYTPVATAQGIDPNDMGYRFGRIIGGITLSTLILGWAGALAFQTSVRLYFRKIIPPQSPETTPAAPPPPCPAA